MKLLTRDKSFYRTLVHLMLVIVLQNVITYSINMADNLMLGAYSQPALSGAATVNQIQFMVQQLTMAISDSLVVLGSQYWGTNRTEPIRRLCGISLIAGLVLGGAIFLATTLCPRALLSLFTKDEEIILQGLAYLELIRFTYPIYVLSAVLMAALRCVETVNVSFGISIVSLIVDVCINYALIFGHFGFPEMGIRGAAVGTLAARILELLIVLGYLLFKDKKLRLFSSNPFKFAFQDIRDFWKILWPSFLSQLLWGIATPIQTGILGRLSSDTIAANAVATTMFQYLKVITVGEASASAVLIGRTVGEGDVEKVKEFSRTLQILYLAIAVLLGVALYFIRIPLLSIYALSDSARVMANQILILLCFIITGMAYQMPAGVGIIKGGGDVRYMMYLDLISTWVIVMPLAFAAAFWWKLSVVAVVACLNCDQIFKCIPTAFRVNRYRWIHKLTRK